MYPRQMYARILISVLTPLDGQHQEELEDEVKRLLSKIGVKAKVKSLSTGNEMTTFNVGSPMITLYTRLLLGRETVRSTKR